MQVKAFLQSPMEGVVLETYGSGNAPNNRPDLLDELKKATDNNVLILNCTQCLRGTVSLVYATGKARQITLQLCFKLELGSIRATLFFLLNFKVQINN